MNNDNLKMQVKSIMGHNDFPGTPLFCQYGQHYGLVGIQSSHKWSKRGQNWELQGDTSKMGHSAWLASNRNSPSFLQTMWNWNKLFPHEVVTLAIFHDIWRKIKDFLFVANFAECPLF